MPWGSTVCNLEKTKCCIAQSCLPKVPMMFNVWNTQLQFFFFYSWLSLPLAVKLWFYQDYKVNLCCSKHLRKNRLRIFFRKLCVHMYCTLWSCVGIRLCAEPFTQTVQLPNKSGTRRHRQNHAFLVIIFVDGQTDTQTHTLVFYSRRFPKIPTCFI